MDTHCKFGIMPGWGLSQKLSRMVGINRARDASFTARKIDAETAYQWGLVSKLFQSKRELLEAAFSTAKMISRNDRKTVENYKDVLIRGYGMSYEDARYGSMPERDNVSIIFLLFLLLCLQTNRLTDRASVSSIL